jgi:hypothetical protein
LCCLLIPSELPSSEPSQRNWLKSLGAYTAAKLMAVLQSVLAQQCKLPQNYGRNSKPRKRQEPPMVSPLSLLCLRWVKYRKNSRTSTELNTRENYDRTLSKSKFPVAANLHVEDEYARHATASFKGARAHDLGEFCVNFGFRCGFNLRSHTCERPQLRFCRCPTL